MQLSDSVGTLPRVGPAYQAKLAKLGINSIRDLLWHIPQRLIDFSKIVSLNQIQVGELVTVRGKLNFLTNRYTKTQRYIQLGEIEDESGFKLTVIWFNQPYLTRVLYPKHEYAFAGEVNWFGRQKALINPLYENSQQQINTGRLLPIYTQTKGLTSRWLRGLIAYTLKQKMPIPDTLPKKILTQESLLPLNKAIRQIHQPQTGQEFKTARYRLAFDELLFLHTQSLKRKRRLSQTQAAHQIKVSNHHLKQFIKQLPFKLTDDQLQAISEINDDLSQPTPMNRLLQGDVGSGKTVVAAQAVYQIFLHHLQTVLMAPTQILALQHYQTLTQLLEPLGVRVALVTSQHHSGEINTADLLVGTHSLIQKYLNFQKVGLVVIDEQHKFGVNQRVDLLALTANHQKASHSLTMTATPIPQTVALTLYGDMSQSIIKQLPSNRQHITTWIIPKEKEASAWPWVEKMIKEKKIGAFVVCPLISESESSSLIQVNSVNQIYREIKKTLPSCKVSLLHGQLKPKIKEKVIKQFASGNTEILVTTPVIEVGIDIPNANIMVILSADRFGLAQLHQLRGRVGRGNEKAYCLLFCDNLTPKIQTRLEILKTAKSGFELSEMDLHLRGPGEIFGTAQHGLPELKIASWQEIDLIKKTRLVAEKLLA